MKRNKKTANDSEALNAEILMMEESLTIWNASKNKGIYYRSV